MARFFVPRESIAGTRATLAGPELDHMRKVLRLRPGQCVVLFDDAGWEHEAVIRSYAPRTAEVEIRRSYQPERESPLDLVLAQAMGRGEKMDWVVEKATELGVRAIVPFVSSRTVPRLNPGTKGTRRSRWEKIALSAAKQSGRTRIPDVMEPGLFGDVTERAWQCDLKLLFWEGEPGESLQDVREERGPVGSVLLVIGPEGGFADEEVAMASAHGFRTVRLGRRILRTETAALSALSIVQFLWGDMR